MLSLTEIIEILIKIFLIVYHSRQKKFFTNTKVTEMKKKELRYQ
jgi:hypothetical protein